MTPLLKKKHSGKKGRVGVHGNSTLWPDRDHDLPRTRGCKPSGGAILSLAALLSLHTLGYSFSPILQKGRVICVMILLGNKVVLTIKDSILLIPGSLGRLAKDEVVKLYEGRTLDKVRN
jgi:hypothetical protein